MADSGAGKYRLRLEDFVPKSKEVSKNEQDTSKGHASQCDRAPAGQIWDNLSNETDESNRLICCGKQEFISAGT